MLKKYTSLLLVTLLVIHLAGVYAYFAVRLLEIRKVAREQLTQLPADQLQVIAVPLDQFRSSWMDDGELSWHGKMYDIARIETSGNIIMIYCLHDTAEDDLLGFISAVIDLSHQEIPETPFSVIQFNLLEFELQDIELPERVATALPSPSGRYLFALTCLRPDPLSPPPRA